MQMYVYIHICACVHVLMYVSKCVCMCACIHACIRVFVRACVCACAFVCMFCWCSGSPTVRRRLREGERSLLQAKDWDSSEDVKVLVMLVRMQAAARDAM